MDVEPPKGFRFVTIGILFEGALGLAAWVLGFVFDLSPLATWQWSLADALIGVAVTLPMLLVFFLCVRWPLGPVAQIHRIAEEVIRPLFVDASILEMLMVAAAAGIGEEMLFRGLLQAGISSRWGSVAGLTIASILFGLLHLITPTYAVLATLLGVYLGWIWQSTESLLVVVVAHALYDFLAITFLTRTRLTPESADPIPADGSD